MELSDEQFDALITRAMDELPQEYITNMVNVAIVMQDEPTEEQKIKMKLRDGMILLGLFEGTPKTSEGAGWFPSKITLFKHSIFAISPDETTLFEQVKRTLWHEIAHYYGLSHQQMDNLQNQK